MKTSLIATVLNADEHIGAFLASIAAQERTPDEVIVVDGGSTDGTLRRLRDAGDSITLIEEPGANIARGRNLAIAAASHDAIAVADADCAYGPGWLAALVAPLEDGADVAMGWTKPVIGSLLDACVASLGFPLAATEVDETTFMPSSRSVAFRREAIDAIGGYPEWLPIGEDMWVDHRWRERGFAMRMAPEAVARWHPRTSLGAIWTQYVRYARGDGQAAMYPERHALRFAVYGGLALALASRRTWPRLLAAGGAVAYARTPVARAHARLTDPRDRAIAAIAVPALLAFTDAAKMWGYLLGLADRLTGRVRPQ
jgi:glycosyltransferase involved in cell wall biosynthesis